MGAYGIFEIHPAEQKFIGLGVFIGKNFPDGIAVVFLGKEPRGSEDHARQAPGSMKQMAEILRRRFGHSVDIRGNRLHVFGNLGCGRAFGRNECGAKGAGRAGEYEAL